MKKRSIYILTLTSACLVLSVFALYFVKSNSLGNTDRVVVAGNGDIEGNSHESSFQVKLSPKCEWNEILIQLQKNEDELPIIDAYLSGENGERIGLNKISKVSYGSRNYLRLSSDLLEWSHLRLKFDHLVIRSNKKFTIIRLFGSRMTLVNQETARLIQCKYR